MFSGLQEAEALNSYPEGNQRTVAFLSNRCAMDHQLGNYKYLLRKMDRTRISFLKMGVITKLLNAPPMFW